MIVVAYIVIFLSFMSLLRMAIFTMGSDIYDIISSRRRPANRKSSDVSYTPLVSVLVPAHNEELGLKRTLKSVYDSTYKNLELIIINDSSTDRTLGIARYFQRRYKSRFTRVKVLNVNVRGKAKALNAGLKFASGEIFMCLDADSVVATHSIETAVRDFEDPSLACMSSNIKIFPGKTFVNLFQRIEYLIGLQVKKTETFAGIQYIVGGAGSLFRTDIVRSVGLYETDTITEDMDLSMKIISVYGKSLRVGYNPLVITHTEAVPSIAGLLRQRTRWRHGSYQVLLKHRNLFFSCSESYNKLLTWFYLPYTLLGQVLSLLEPVIFGFIVYIVIQSGSLSVIATSFLIFIFYVTMQITAATKGYTSSERLRLIAASPVAYLGMYVLSLVEYLATLRGVFNLHKIYCGYKTGSGTGHWTHVERKGNATAIL